MSLMYTITYVLYRSIFLYSVISTAYLVNGNDPNCDKVRSSGTGTVLFNPTDGYKTCWSQEEIAILTARIILEDVIPDPKMISVQCNEDIENLVDYFKVVIENIRSGAKARKRHIMLLALTDLLGGFLHQALLPMARKAYYSGAVDYLYMEKVIQLYEELKWFLRTNGQGWTKPMIVNKQVKVPIIELETMTEKKEHNDSCCHKVMYYEHEPLTKSKRSVNTEKGIYFPLPFFDAKIKPTAIALPLKKFALRNIESKRAAYAVMKYFIAAEQCLKEKNANPNMVQKFQNNLYTWIEKEVIPKLTDDKFYSAFGGILRVQTTLKTLGARLGSHPCNTDEGEEEVGAIPGVGCGSRRNKILLIAMLVVIIAWFLIGTCFICYRMKNNKSSPKSFPPEDSKPSSKSESSSTYSSSRWSSFLSKSSSRTDKQLCKCCESSISGKSTTGLSSTSEYDSEKSRRPREKRNSKLFKGKKTSNSSPCICPPSEGPAVIDTKHSMKVLPSIAEMSEQSLQTDKTAIHRKISFADESPISTSDGGIKICAPPWSQTKNTVLCPKLLDKSFNFSSSKSSISKSQAVQDSFSDPPIASSSGFDADPSGVQRSNQSYGPPATQTSNQLGQSYETNNKMDQSKSYSHQEFEEPLANSTFKHEATEASNDYGTSNMSTSPLENTSSKSINKKESDEHSHDDMIKTRVKEEPGLKEEKENSYYNYHAEACHSSLSGNYDLFHKPDPNKPYIFGYDFQTSTSSEVSDDDDLKY